MSIAPSVPLAALGVVSLKAVLLLMVGWCTTRALARAPAAARHLVWLTVMLGVLSIPVLDRLMPMRVPILPATIAAPMHPVQPSAPTSSAEVVPTHGQVASPAESMNAKPRSVRRPMNVAQLVLVIWATGAGLLLVRLLLGVLSVSRLVRRGKPVETSDWMRSLGDAARRLSVPSPRLVMSDQVEMAFAFDATSPTIILPASAHEWPDDLRRAVLLHELAHIRRRDLIGHSVAGITCAVHWFNPLIWVAARQLRVESELASDEIVLGTGFKPSQYAQHLLDMVTSFGRRTPTVALAMARPREFEGRLVAILDPLRRSASPARPQRATIGLVGLFAVTIGMAVPVRQGGTVPPITSPVEPVATATSIRAAKRERSIAPLAPATRGTPSRSSPTLGLSSEAIPLLLRFGTGGIINPMMMLLREADSLQLTGWQADSIATLNRRYMVRLSGIWAPVSAYYSGHAPPGSEQRAIAAAAEAPRRTVDALLEILPSVNGLLTPEQRRRMSQLTATYLDAQNLAAVARAANGPGVFLTIDRLYGLRGRGRGGG